MTSTDEPVGNTCPQIDRVIEYLVEVEQIVTTAINEIWKLEELTTDQRDILIAPLEDIYSKPSVDTMEEIRDANESLRNWGRELCDDIFDLEAKNQELSRQCITCDKE